MLFRFSYIFESKDDVTFESLQRLLSIGYVGFVQYLFSILKFSSKLFRMFYDEMRQAIVLLFVVQLLCYIVE